MRSVLAAAAFMAPAACADAPHLSPRPVPASEAPAAAPGSWPTIERAEPIPHDTALPPPDGRPKNEIDWYARAEGVSQDEARRRMWLQHVYGPKAGELRERLLKAEPGNFGDLWIEHQPDWRVAVAFKRDPDATLRRYTTDPVFVARKAAASLQELEATRARVERQLQAFSWSYGLGSDVRAGVVSVELFEEAETVERARETGKLDLSGPVRVTTLDPLPLPPVADATRRFVRVFPQDPGRVGIQTSELSTGTLVLRDGCLRLAGPGRAVPPFAYFAKEVGLTVSPAGKLSLLDRRTGRLLAHIGERLAMGGGAGRPVTDAEAVAPIAAACGPGPVAYVGTPSSYAAFRMRNVAWKIDERARVDRVSRAEAFKRFRAEWARDDADYEARILRGTGAG